MCVDSSPHANVLAWNANWFVFNWRIIWQRNGEWKVAYTNENKINEKYALDSKPDR